MSTAVDAEDLELPEELDVKVAALLDTVAKLRSWNTDNLAIWNTCVSCQNEV